MTEKQFEEKTKNLGDALKIVGASLPQGFGQIGMCPQCHVEPVYGIFLGKGAYRPLKDENGAPVRLCAVCASKDEEEEIIMKNREAGWGLAKDLEERRDLGIGQNMSKADAKAKKRKVSRGNSF